jgi:ABC-2 type transport system ATP-binding protein
LRRLLPALFAGSVVAAALALPSHAAPAWTSTAYTINVVDGPADDEHIAIDATLYVPAGVDASNPAPVVVAANGFGGSKDDFAGKEAPFLASHGYVVLAYSSRGFGASTGEIGLDSPDYDVKDVQQLVSWLAARPEVQLDGPGDPRLGMIGPSYGGGIQLMAAEYDKRIDVIVPFITWNSLVYALDPNNDDRDMRHEAEAGVFKHEWTSLFFGLGTAQPVASQPGATMPPRQCLGFVDGLCQAYYTSMATGNATPETIALLKKSSPETLRRRLRVPTLLIQGQSDTLFNLNDAVANYTALRENDVPVKMIWANGGHGYTDAPGERSWTDPSKDVLAGRVLAWYDRFLRRDRTVDVGPRFEYFRDWVPYDAAGSAESAYASASRFPVGSRRTLFLSGTSSLVSAPADVQAGTATFVNPPAGAPVSYSETSNFQQSNFSSVAATDAPGTFASFTTAAFGTDTDVVGVPVAKVRLTSAIGLVTVFAKVYDVAPDGTAVLVRRLVAPVRATDLSRPVTITLAGFAHRFATGHSLRLVLAATDAAYRAQPVPTTYGVVTDPALPSTLTLPVL